MRVFATTALVILTFDIFQCSVLRDENPDASSDEEELLIEEAQYVDVPSEKTNTTGLKIGSFENEDNVDKVTYEGFQLWKVVTDTNDKLKLIGNLKKESDITTWGGNRSNIDILVNPKNVEKVQDRLRSNLIDYEVLIHDLQKAIEEENPAEDEDETQNRYGHRMTFTSYHRLSDIHNYLDYLAETYPSFCKIHIIGRSVQGRPLKLLKISNGKQGNKAVWIDGGMHAREWITPATVSYIIDHLVNKIETESRALQNLDYYVLPVANPDGYEYSHNSDRLWRKNRSRQSQCQGTDLNRNFGYKWGGQGSGKNPCQEIYGGSGPFSEPETESIRNFITQTSGANWKAYVSFHSYGQYILYPWGYDRVVPPDHRDLQSVGRQAANAIRQSGGMAYTVGPSGSTLYPAAGGSDDWAKGVVGIKYAYTIELRDNGRYGFVLPASYIIPTAKEGLEALKVIAEAASAA